MPEDAMQEKITMWDGTKLVPLIELPFEVSPTISPKTR